LLKAVLHSEGLAFAAYKDRFGSDVRNDFPELEMLLQSGMAVVERGELRLTDEGLAYSDAIGDWLISPEVRERMEGFEFA